MVVTKKKIRRIPRAVTKIEGFDELVEGGFPRTSSVLLSGAPGTGKTIFGMEFIYQGALIGEPGIYLTLEESEQKMRYQAADFGWDIQPLIDDGLFKLVIPETNDLEELLGSLKMEVKKLKAKRLVIDSLPMMSVLTSVFSSTSKQIYDKGAFKFNPKNGKMPMKGQEIGRSELSFIINYINSLGTTSLLISEVGESENLGYYSRDTISEFLCDGVIIFHGLDVGGDSTHELCIKKMRWTNNRRGYYSMSITSEGLKINSEQSSSILLR